jgi:hypothetical protein
MYSNEQLQLLLDGDSLHNLYFDATGSIFKKWQGFDKRMLLYSLVLQNRHTNEPPVPICEMICNEHKTEMISHMLFCLRMDLNRMNKCSRAYFPSQLIVTDFSWALIHSVLHSLNPALDIDSYMKHTFESMVNERVWKPVTGVFICANHVVHILTRKLNKMKKCSQFLHKEEFIHSFVLLQYSQTFNDAIETVKLIYMVFGSVEDNKIVRSARKTLLRNIRKWKTNEKCDTNSDPCAYNEIQDDNEEVTVGKSEKTIRDSSPWLEYFQKIHDSTAHKSSRTEENNPFYSEDVIKYFIRHWLSLFPL